MTQESKMYLFVKELRNFSYTLSCLDREWGLVFPDRNEKWRHLHTTQYKKTFYVGDIDGECGILEVAPGKGIWPMDPMGAPRRHELADDPQLSAKWESLILSARRWLKVVARDWIKANRKVWDSYPLNRRYGIVPNSIVSASLPDIYRLDRELGKMRTRKFVRLVEDGYFMHEDNTVRDSMTAADYFEYCRIAYIAAERKGESVDRLLSGREMYARYADGRHEGLLDIIGIVPCYRWLHRANQRFGKDEDVYDVMHYDDLGRFK